MSRFLQREGYRRSLKWIQLLVNEYPELINEPLREACGPSSYKQIEWLSPLLADHFAEYRDEAFLDRLSIPVKKRRLATF